MNAEVVQLRDMKDDKDRKADQGWSVELALEVALARIRSGEVWADRALIVLLDARGERYDRYQIQAGMDRMEIVALCEATKFAALYRHDGESGA